MRVIENEEASGWSSHEFLSGKEKWKKIETVSNIERMSFMWVEHKRRKRSSKKQDPKYNGS